MPLGMEVNLGLGDVVLDGGRSSPPPKRGTASQCSARIYCDQTVGWNQTPLCTEVDLGLGHTVLTRTKFPLPRKGHSSPPLFSDHVYCGYDRPSQLLLLFIYFVKNM